MLTSLCCPLHILIFTFFFSFYSYNTQHRQFQHGRSVRQPAEDTWKKMILCHCLPKLCCFQHLLTQDCCLESSLSLLQTHPAMTSGEGIKGDPQQHKSSFISIGKEAWRGNTDISPFCANIRAAAQPSTPAAGAAQECPLHPRSVPCPPQGTLPSPGHPHPAAAHRDLCGTWTIDVLCAWGQLNGSSVISLSRG